MAVSIPALIGNGAAIRARDRLGFYAVQSGKQIPVDQQEAERLVKAKKLVPAGRNQWGVMFFSWNEQKTGAAKR